VSHYALNTRRACRLVKQTRSTQYYRSIKGFWCITGTQSEETHRFDVRIDHGVSAWSQIVRSEVPTRGRPRPKENWCLWILCASSIPAIVTAALANDLKPRMGPHLCLIAR